MLYFILGNVTLNEKDANKWPSSRRKENVNLPMEKNIRNSATVKDLSSWNSVDMVRTYTKSQTKVIVLSGVSAR